MKLYFNPRSRAVITRWMLDECGAEYELVLIDLEKKQQKSPEFLAVNPAGKLPALVDGTTKVFENAAIGLYLGDRFPQAKLAPAIGSPDRGRYLSLMVYSTSQLEPAMGDALLKMETPSSRGWTNFDTAKDVLERELGEGPYLFGEQFTMADIMNGSMFLWARLWGTRTERPALEAWLDRLAARPQAMKF
ncbi:MAG TPA: glutathione S-transferase family protein [Povalibacter sp.]|uniref:glutathione S-transferase family protein n=1 Tax=Povalibacter sp. TaxID=1962978 RepID=UPI002C70AE01|nr:glutathione S-transferase family protein [Povalibacter sp.]HMN45897.1 glutathione S-transferase family protein [Povalibacter sp.]